MPLGFTLGQIASFLRACESGRPPRREVRASASRLAEDMDRQGGALVSADEEGGLADIRNMRRATEANGCPRNCPGDAPTQRVQSQRKPNRLKREVKERAGFARRIGDVRAANFR